jgi:hypothetical protein
VLGVARLVVRGEECHRQEERRVVAGMTPDEVDRLVAEHVRLVVARDLSADVAVGVLAPVLEDVIAPHPVRGVVDEAVPLRPTARDVRRLAVLAVAVQELPHVRGGVAGSLEPHR